MIPLLFGAHERLLAGIYSPAVSGRRGRAALICPPLGQEHLRAHRTGRVMAERLADVGVDVLRFDYYGTGESAGTGEDVRLEGLVEDAETALQEVRDLTGAFDVTLVGIRLGALVAALAASRSDAHRLVLCDPVLDGAGYAASLGELADGRPGEDGGLHVQGFPVPGPFRRELEEQRLDALPRLPEDLLVVSVQDAPEHAWLRGQVADRDGAAELHIVEQEPYWVEGEGNSVGVVPAELVGRVAAWHP